MTKFFKPGRFWSTHHQLGRQSFELRFPYRYSDGPQAEAQSDCELSSEVVTQHREAAPVDGAALQEQALKLIGDDHPDVAQRLNNLAGLYDLQGRHAEAQPLYERALAVWEKTLGPDHPNVAVSLNNLAVLFYAQGRYAAAEPLHKRALAIWETALGPHHPDVTTSVHNLAELYNAQGRYAEAQELYERASAAPQPPPNRKKDGRRSKKTGPDSKPVSR